MRFAHTPSLVGDLEHWQHDTFVVRWRDRELRADAFVTFALNPDGTIDQAKMRAVSPDTDFSFDFQDLLLRPRRKRNGDTFRFLQREASPCRKRKVSPFRHRFRKTRMCCQGSTSMTRSNR